MDEPLIGKALRLVLDMGALIDQLTTLGVEYERKTITPERFAERTHELLLDYQKTVAKAKP